MLIDDNHQHLETTAQLFNHEGYKTKTISHPESALEQIAGDQPRLIVLDIMMPGVDGFSLLRAIKNDVRTSGIPVIILSGKVFMPDKKKAISLGAAKFLTKPIHSDLLLNEIKEYL
jgi:CheY-like chemotaxis protein